MIQRLAPLPTPDTAYQRVQALIEAFRDAPTGSEIAMGTGRAHETGTPAVLTTIGGDDTVHVLSPAEARSVADLIEDSIRQCPDDPECSNLANLVMALREAAKRLEEGQ